MPHQGLQRCMHSKIKLAAFVRYEKEVMLKKGCILNDKHATMIV